MISLSERGFAGWRARTGRDTRPPGAGVDAVRCWVLVAIGPIWARGRSLSNFCSNRKGLPVRHRAGAFMWNTSTWGRGFGVHHHYPKDARRAWDRVQTALAAFGVQTHPAALGASLRAGVEAV